MKRTEYNFFGNTFNAWRLRKWSLACLGFGINGLRIVDNLLFPFLRLVRVSWLVSTKGMGKTTDEVRRKMGFAHTETQTTEKIVCIKLQIITKKHMNVPTMQISREQRFPM